MNTCRLAVWDRRRCAIADGLAKRQRIFRHHRKATDERVPQRRIAEEFPCPSARKPFAREAERITNGRSEDHAAEQRRLVECG